MVNGSVEPKSPWWVIYDYKRTAWIWSLIIGEFLGIFILLSSSSKFFPSKFFPAAFDDAIDDGCDIISLLVGGSFPLDYFDDSIAIGAFHSMKNGILTSNSVVNSGPGDGSITNLSPWSLSVAASSIDRKFLTQVVLGNNMTYEGPTINTFDGAVHPIVYGASVPNTQKT